MAPPFELPDASVLAYIHPGRVVYNSNPLQEP